MKIIAISDLHGHLPIIPECDLLLIAGDVCYHGRVNQQITWLNTKFWKWLKNIPAKKIIGIAGNHDWPFFSEPEEVDQLGLPWTYLQDSQTEFEGLTIYGSPWQRTFHNWAFNLDEDELNVVFDKIPKCDILLTHSPPFGIGDLTSRGEQVGSMRLLTKTQEIKPKLHIFGHIHAGRGIYTYDNRTYVNATIVNEEYNMIYKPMEFEI